MKWILIKKHYFDKYKIPPPPEKKKTIKYFFLFLFSKVSLDEGDCIILKYCTRNFIATGSTNGVVNLRDPNSLQVIQRFTPHHGSLSDLDINNMYLVTCGFTRK